MLMTLNVCSNLKEGKFGPGDVAWCGALCNAIAAQVKNNDYTFVYTQCGFSAVTVFLMKFKDADTVGAVNELYLSWFDCINERMDDSFVQMILMPHMYPTMDEEVLLDRFFKIFKNKSLPESIHSKVIYPLSALAGKPVALKYVNEFLESGEKTIITALLQSVQLNPSHADALLNQIPTLIRLAKTASEDVSPVAAQTLQTLATKDPKSFQSLELLDSILDAIENPDHPNQYYAAVKPSQIAQVLTAVGNSDDDEVLQGVLSRSLARVTKAMSSNDVMVKMSAISLVMPLNRLSKEKPDLVKMYRPVIDSLLQNSKITNEVKEQLKLVVNELDGMTLENLGSMFSTTMKTLGIDPKDPFFDAVQALEGAEVKEFDVMLSYNWNHKSTVIRIRDSLIHRGLSVWMDLDQMSGNVYAKMAEAVLGSKVVVPCLTLAYEASGNCKRELGFAADNTRSGKKIVPVRLEMGPFTWSALITAGLLYTPIGDEELNDEARWETAMDGLEREIRAALEGVESGKGSKAHLDTGVVQKKKEGAAEIVPVEGEVEGGEYVVVETVPESVGGAGESSSVGAVTGAVAGVTATTAVAMVSLEAVTALDARVQALEDVTRGFGETIETSNSTVTARLDRLEELLVGLTARLDNLNSGSVAQGQREDVGSGVDERFRQLESVLEAQARTIEMQKKTIDSLMTFMGVRVREQN
ncbi:hypothetical protein HDU76_006960 [Blyttiomyces sp. JEL0837]|nr:hypothetical protein HDU76_006960 [Blyttiomyces sp. JEL0837]